MTLHDLIVSLRKHLALVLLTTIAVTGAVGVVSSMSSPVFRASSSLYFTLDVGSSASDFNQGSAYTQSQMLSFAQLATLPVVLDPVIEELDLDVRASALARTIAVSRPQDTAILEIAVTGGSPSFVAGVANAVAEQLATTVEDLAPRDAEGDSTVNVRVVKEAIPPQYQIAPSTKRNVVVGFVGGLLAGILAAYLRDVLDTRVRRPQDVQDAVDVPVLAEVSRFGRRTPSAPALIGGPSGPVAEDFRRLRTNLQFLDVDAEGLCLVLSSAVPGEGKTTTAVNLALALAEADMRVLLVDADMRRPRVADYTGLEGSAGLTTVLIGRATAREVIQPWSGIDVLTAGEVPPNPAELVATRALRDMLEDLRAEYDVVLLDAPPVLPVADAVILSRIASGVVLVADTRRLRRAQLRDVVEAVEKAGGHLLGIVLNKVAGRRGGSYGYESRATRTSPAMRPRTAGVRELRPEPTADATDEGVEGAAQSRSLPGARRTEAHGDGAHVLDAPPPADEALAPAPEGDVTAGAHESTSATDADGVTVGAHGAER